MEEHDYKHNKEVSSEVTDSGFADDAKDGDQTFFSMSRSSGLYVRSPSCETAIREREKAPVPIQSQGEENYGLTTLQNAILSGEETIACCIISNRDSRDCLELKTDYLETPLILAVERRMQRVASLLIKASVDLDCINSELSNILHIAAKNNDAGMLQLLISTVADTDILAKLANSVDDNGNIPLHVSVMQKNLECALLLLSAGSNIDKKAYKDGYTCLHFAVLTNDPSFVREFITKCQPDPYMMSHAEQTPYELAYDNCFEDVMLVLDELEAAIH